MSYYDPEIYNVGALKDEDREELEFWDELFGNVCDAVEEDFRPLKAESVVERAYQEIAADVLEKLREEWERRWTETMAGTIDSYEEG